MADEPTMNKQGSFWQKTMQEMPQSPLWGQLPDDICAQWGRLPTLEQAVLESRMNILATTEAWRGAAGSLDEPLTPSEGSGVLSFSQAVFNLVNIIVGVGVLSVPYALRMSGYSAVLILLVVICITGTTAKWIGESIDLASQSEQAKHVPPSARDFGFLALVTIGPRFQVFINIVTVLEVWFALVTFMVMNGVNAGLVWPGLEATTSIPAFGVLACALVFVPQHIFAYLSLVSTFSIVVAGVAMAGATFLLDHWAEPYEHFGRDAILQLENVPRSVGIIIFCFAGHPCFPGVVSSMKAPSRWSSSIIISFLAACTYYGFFGILGYVVFGDYTSEMLTNNVGQIRGAVHFRLVAAVCFLLKVQLTVPLLLNAIAVALWAPGALEPQWPVMRKMMVFAISGVTVLTALCFADKVAVVASLAGSLLVMITSVLFPALVHLTLSQKYLGHPIAFWAMLQYVGIIGFGAVMAVLGTILAIKDLGT